MLEKQVRVLDEARSIETQVLALLPEELNS